MGRICLFFILGSFIESRMVSGEERSLRMFICDKQGLRQGVWRMSEVTFSEGFWGPRDILFSDLNAGYMGCSMKIHHVQPQFGHFSDICYIS